MAAASAKIPSVVENGPNTFFSEYNNKGRLISRRKTLRKNSPMPAVVEMGPNNNYFNNNEGIAEAMRLSLASAPKPAAAGARGGGSAGGPAIPIATPIPVGIPVALPLSGPATKKNNNSNLRAEIARLRAELNALKGKKNKPRTRKLYSPTLSPQEEIDFLIFRDPRDKLEVDSYFYVRVGVPMFSSTYGRSVETIRLKDYIENKRNLIKFKFGSSALYKLDSTSYDQIKLHYNSKSTESMAEQFLNREKIVMEKAVANSIEPLKLAKLDEITSSGVCGLKGPLFDLFYSALSKFPELLVKYNARQSETAKSQICYSGYVPRDYNYAMYMLYNEFMNILKAKGVRVEGL